MIEVCTESVEEAMAVWQEVRGEGSAWGEFRKFVGRGLKWFVEESLSEAVRRKVGIAWYMRGDGRDGYRNGFYTRMLVTPYGSVEMWSALESIISSPSVETRLQRKAMSLVSSGISRLAASSGPRPV